MKAIVLISGGLDSALTVRVLQKQNIEVCAVHFVTPFAGYTLETIAQTYAGRVAAELQCEFKAIALGTDYLEMVKHPEFGYGKNMNPCIDCKILMLAYAKRLMQEWGASFVATGEVLGQRPMSQQSRQLSLIEQQSGLQGLLVRPLSALLLPETIPQKEGWLKKECLFDFQGRGRTSQLALAQSWGVSEYSWPGGGCLLTDKGFSRRLRDLIAHDQLNLHAVEVAKTGRYFRISPKVLLSLGRNEQENEKLVAIADSHDTVFQPTTVPGPSAVLCGWPAEGELDTAAQIMAYYTDRTQTIPLVFAVSQGARRQTRQACACPEEKVKQLRVA